MNEELYELLKEGVLGCSTTEYESLPTNNAGAKLAEGVPQGSLLEVYDETSGEVSSKYKAIKGVWYSYDTSSGGGGSKISDTSQLNLNNATLESYGGSSTKQNEVNIEVVESLQEIIKKGIDDLDTVAVANIERRPYYQKTKTTKRTKGLYWYNTDSTETDKWEKISNDLFVDITDKLKSANTDLTLDGSVLKYSDSIAFCKVVATLNTPITDLQSGDRLLATIPSDITIPNQSINLKIKTHEGNFTAKENVAELPTSYTNSDTLQTYDVQNDGTQYYVSQDYNKQTGELIYDRNGNPSLSGASTKIQIKSGETKTIYLPLDAVGVYYYEICGYDAVTITDFTGATKTINVPRYYMANISVTANEEYMKLCAYAKSGLNVDTNGNYGYYTIKESDASKLYSLHSEKEGLLNGFDGTVEFTKAENVSAWQAVDGAYIKDNKIYVKGNLTIDSFVFCETL